MFRDGQCSIGGREVKEGDYLVPTGAGQEGLTILSKEGFEAEYELYPKEEYFPIEESRLPGHLQPILVTRIEPEVTDVEDVWVCLAATAAAVPGKATCRIRADDHGSTVVSPDGYPTGGEGVAVLLPFGDGRLQTSHARKVAAEAPEGNWVVNMDGRVVKVDHRCMGAAYRVLGTSTLPNIVVL